MNHRFGTACLGLGVLLALGACENMDTGDGTVAISGRDSCGAIDHQDLVGQSAASLDASALPAGTRVLYPGMPATTEDRADRMSVEVGGGDNVTRVFCG